jgi:hypothetical protein
VAATSQAVLLSSFLNQNAPHGLGCRDKEVSPTVPAPGLVIMHDTKIRLMHQGSWLKRAAG